MESNITIVYNFAQLYRQPIFELIDKTWKCKWYFGKTSTDIKEMDVSVLNDVEFVENKNLIGPLQTQKGVGKIIRRKDTLTMLMLGEPMVLSTWWTLIQRRLFYPKKRVYLWSHGWYGREGLAKKWLKRIFFGLADHVFTYGEYAKNMAIAQGFDGSKITPIHNSLNHAGQVALRSKLQPSDIYKSHFKNDFPVLLFVGRLTAVKRLDLLLLALKELKDQNQIFNLILIGDGEKRKELEKMAEELGILNQVWFYGACYDDTQNAQLIYDADLCVAPGNVGLTAMHSMVFGTPVLTHDDFKWQMPEFEAIRPNKTGLFFKKDEVSSLTSAIEDWFKNGSEREATRKACFDEIDTNWTPEFQLNILKNII